jgi:hypothetical protein
MCFGLATSKSSASARSHQHRPLHKTEPARFASPTAAYAGRPYRGQRSSCLTSAARCGGMGLARASYWSLRHCPIADSPTRLSRPSLGRLVAADARSNRRPLLWIDRFGIIQLYGVLRVFSATRRPLVTCCERGVQKRKTEYGFVAGKNGFNCVSCGTRRAEWRIPLSTSSSRSYPNRNLTAARCKGACRRAGAA